MKHLRIDAHLVIIALIASLAASMFLPDALKFISAISFCQFYLITNAYSPKFRGWNYLISNELLIVLIVAIVTVLVGSPKFA